MKLGMHIMAPELISAGYVINPSNQSVCLYVYPPIVARQELGKNVTAATNTFAIEYVVDVSFYVVRVVSEESRRSVPSRTRC
jgi:hypothetical protein